jgi:hypothetical protein
LIYKSRNAFQFSCHFWKSGAKRPFGENNLIIIIIKILPSYNQGRFAPLFQKWQEKSPVGKKPFLEKTQSKFKDIYSRESFAPLFQKWQEN